MTEPAYPQTRHDYADDAEELQQLEPPWTVALGAPQPCRRSPLFAAVGVARHLLFVFLRAARSAEMAINERTILQSELRWTLVVGGIIAVIIGAMVVRCTHEHVNPPSNREFVDPRT